MKRVERVDAPDPGEFRRRFSSPGTPVVVTGVANRWPAVGRWTPEYFGEKFADLEVVVEEWLGDERRNDAQSWMSGIRYSRATLADFVRMLRRLDRPTRRYYLAMWPVFQHLPELRSEIVSPTDFMDFPRMLPAALRSRLTLEPLLYLGPAGSITPLHYDSEDNLFVQVHGSKRVLLVPPRHSRRVGFPCYEFKSLNFSPVEMEQPDLERFPSLAQIDVWEAEVGPGELLFIPVGWWHYLRALETSVSLSFWWRTPARMARLMRFAYPKLRAELLDRAGLRRPLRMPQRPTIAAAAELAVDGRSLHP